MSEQQPKIVASRNGYRLVHRVRDQERWPKFSDLTLEVELTDAMGEKFWKYENSWMLCPEKTLSEAASARVALNMLLNSWDVVEK